MGVVSQAAASEATSVPTILLVDDELSARAVISAILARVPGFHVIEAGDGIGAWERALSELPDLILLDITLPGIDGIEVLARLKSEDETLDIPVIMVTGRTGEADRKRCAELGAEGYLAKPFAPTDLISMIKELLPD